MDQYPLFVGASIAAFIQVQLEESPFLLQLFKNPITTNILGVLPIPLLAVSFFQQPMRYRWLVGHFSRVRRGVSLTCNTLQYPLE
jgi:hypothetical protein